MAQLDQPHAAVAQGLAKSLPLLLLEFGAFALRHGPHALPRFSELAQLLDAFGIGPRPRRRRRGVKDVFVIEQMADRLFQPHRFQRFNLSRSPSKTDRKSVV